MIVYLTRESKLQPYQYQWLKTQNFILSAAILENTQTLHQIDPPQTTGQAQYTQHFQIIKNPILIQGQLSFDAFRDFKEIFYDENLSILDLNKQRLSLQQYRIISFLNYQKQGKSSNRQLYSRYIAGQRNKVLQMLLKIILGCFLLFIFLHFYVYKLLLIIISTVNKLCRVLGYTPLVMLQNQMIFKCKLITKQLQGSLIKLFIIQNGLSITKYTSKYSQVLKDYLQILNVLTFIIIDSVLGLVSVFVTYYTITLLLCSLKYVKETLHVLLVDHKSQMTSLKQIVSGNDLYSTLLQKLFQLLLQNYQEYFEININSTVFFNFYLILGYLGFSFQILLTIQFSYLTSINIFSLYKIITLLYEGTIKVIKYCYKIVTFDPQKTITIQLKDMQKQPWIKIPAVIVLMVVSATLPLTVVYYLWLVVIIILSKIFINLLKNTVSILNNIPLGSILITLKKPHLYPPFFQYKQSNECLLLAEYRQIRLKIIYKQIKNLVSQYEPLISVQMIKQILAGKDLLKRPELQKQDQTHLDCYRLFTCLMKI